jgi:cytochrome c oxidase subunit 2
MFEGFRLFPERASTAAHQVDALILFMLAVTVVMTLLIASLLVYFSIKYRRRSDTEEPVPVEGSLKLEIFWSAVPLVVGLVMFAWGAKIYFYIVQPPKDAMEIYVVGKQWMWKIQHPEGQREINELHVPVDQPVKLTLTSEDVIHDLFVPAFRVKVDVLPGRYVQTWFQATKVGRYRFFCSQYCGTDHSGMVGYVTVMPQEEYRRWLASSAEGSMALEGRKLFLMYQCVSCHSADAYARAPVLENVFNRRVPLQDGRTALADETYLRESIVNPDAKIVAGYQPIMPSFAGQIDEEGLLKLIAFLKALGPGQTPPRVDQAPPPTVGAPSEKVTPPAAASPAAAGKEPSP